MIGIQLVKSILNKNNLNCHEIDYEIIMKFKIKKILFSKFILINLSYLDIYIIFVIHFLFKIARPMKKNY